MTRITYPSTISQFCKLRFLCIALVMTGVSCAATAQSKTTEKLHKQNDGALALFFYNNTLRMLNQSDDKEFDELIRDIEKMKFLMIDKDDHFGPSEYNRLVTDYKAESFEEIMTSRYQARNFDVFLKEKNGKNQGMIITVNDSTNLYVLDIVGTVSLDKVTKLFSTIDESTDIGKKIKAFAKKD
jgi:hypothetical protein